MKNLVMMLAFAFFAFSPISAEAKDCRCSEKAEQCQCESCDCEASECDCSENSQCDCDCEDCHTK